jgi:hypothetical protein
MGVNGAMTLHLPERACHRRRAGHGRAAGQRCFLGRHEILSHCPGSGDPADLVVGFGNRIELQSPRSDDADARRFGGRSERPIRR